MYHHMLFISWNINGIRSRFAGLQRLVADYAPDFVCLQKVRNNSGRGDFSIDGYCQLYTPEDCGDWSGVMTYVRNSAGAAPHRVATPELSRDGHLQLYAFGDFYLVNAYVPFAGFSVAGAVERRREWDSRFRLLMTRLTSVKPVVACGDFNVVHTVMDTCEDRLELQRPCFTKWERDNFNRLLSGADLADTYRVTHPGEQAVTYYGNFRHMKIGNRIDYILVSRSLLKYPLLSEILSDFVSGQSVPVTLEMEI